MIKIPLAQIIDRIVQEKGIDRDSVNDMLKKKMQELSGLISEEGAAHIIANELGIKLFQVGGSIKVKDGMVMLTPVGLTIENEIAVRLTP